ncbi:MAG: ribonuclease III [Clostridiales bacterium]|nr:ribonuclease III [Clostridiales bacterium]
MKINESRISELKALQETLHYRFSNLELLNTALTHTSYVKGENRSSGHNERLEFLGDAVLELIVSEYLFINNPGMNEGLMTRIRSRAVYENALYDAARRVDLGKYLLLSHGEEHTGGRDKPSILSDALEAVIGAMYLDGGIEPAKDFILSFAVDFIHEAVKTISVKDFKTLLQEHIQQQHSGTLEYEVVSVSGPDHKRVFTMVAVINGKPMGKGQGNSKQEAGQNAAHATLVMLGALDPSGKEAAE